MTDERRNDELAAFISLCFFSLDTDPKEIANRSGLSLATIYRLRSGQFSLNVRFGTIQKLGIAAGLGIQMTETKVRMVVL